MSEPGGDDRDLTPSERRLGYRYLACFPAYIEREDTGKKRTSMIRDLSVSGALLLTQTPLEIGETVRLELFISPDDLETSVSAVGKVTRVERLGLDRSDVWSHKVAVQFDDPLSQYETEVKALAERQAKLGFAR
jgi:hypothetical protein